MAYTVLAVKVFEVRKWVLSILLTRVRVVEFQLLASVMAARTSSSEEGLDLPDNPSQLRDIYYGNGCTTTQPRTRPVPPVQRLFDQVSYGLHKLETYIRITALFAS